MESPKYMEIQSIMSHLKSMIYQNITTDLHKVYDDSRWMSKEYDCSGSQTGTICILAFTIHIYFKQKSKV